MAKRQTYGKTELFLEWGASLRVLEIVRDCDMKYYIFKMYLSHILKVLVGQSLTF